MSIDINEGIEFLQGIARNEIVYVTPKGNIIGDVALAAYGEITELSEECLPLPKVIANMSQTQKQAVVNIVERIMEDTGVVNFDAFHDHVTSSLRLEKRVIREILNYIEREVRWTTT